MAEKVLISHGHYQVESWRMENILTQEINDGEKERIVKNRVEWLDWMNRHFANITIPAPEKYK